MTFALVLLAEVPHAVWEAKQECCVLGRMILDEQVKGIVSTRRSAFFRLETASETKGES